MARHHEIKDEQWIDSVRQQSFLTNTPWEEVRNVLGEALARLIHQDFASFSKGQRSALFDLLGRRFFEVYMQGYKIECNLEPDARSLRDMKEYLPVKLNQALRDSHLDQNSSESRDLKDFKQFLKRLFARSSREALQRKVVTDEQREPKESCNEELLRETFSLETTRSNIFGEAVAHILDRQPNMFETVCSRVKGQQLPASLRRKVWLWILLSENKKPDNWCFSTLEETFHNNLSRRKVQMSNSSASSSPAKCLIQTMVKEKFKSVPCLQTLTNSDVESIIKEAMNIHHVCHSSCDPISVLHLFPLYIGLFVNLSDDDDVPVALAMSVNLLQVHLIPDTEDTELIIANVLDRLEERDSVLFQHLEDCAEMHKMQECLEMKYQNSKLTTASTNGLTILLSPWIKMVFVNILSRPAIIYIWDQLFLMSWDARTFENICLCLILLLRRKLIDEAKDYTTLLKVLSEEPSRLLTADIQRDYRHILRERDLSPIPTFIHLVKDRDLTPIRNDSPLSILPSEPAEVTTPAPPDMGFDLYIDGILNLPDHATITKVTGRILTPTIATPDILAPPDLDCDSKCPTYTYRYTSEAGLQKTNILTSLHVHTVNALTKDIVLVGSCAWNLYKESNTQAILKVGAFKLNLRRGLPENKFSPIEEDFQNLAKVPGCWLMVRVLPRSEAFVERPPLELSNYTALHQFDQTTANKAEESQELPDRKMEREVALGLRKEEEGLDNDLSDADLTTWIMARLDSKTRLGSCELPPQMDPAHFYKYDPKIGLKVKVQGAHGLNGKNLYHGILVSLIQGIKSLSESGVLDIRLLVAAPQLDSSASAPQWSDHAKVIHPIHDENSCLLLEILVSTIERPSAKGRTWNQAFKMGSLSNFAWTLVPLFTQTSLIQGAHYIPLFQKSKEKPFLKSLLTEDLLSVIKTNLHKKYIKEFKSHPSVVVELFDGHFDYQDALPLPIKTDMLTLTGNYNKYDTVAKQLYSGPSISSVLIGEKRLTTEEEKDALRKLTKTAFQKVVNTALTNDGLEPMSAD